jgi:ABC-2 type transport system ATP-binding protein/lipopolysaccharide transport system ATP-binding protein
VTDTQAPAQVEMTQAEERAAGEPAIVVENVSKRFVLHRDQPTNLKERFVRRSKSGRTEDFWALRDISLTIPRGTTYGLIGHNGSGKSTLLKLIAGIHRPTSGSITAHGRVSAMLELGAGFHPELSGRDNVYLNGSILGLSRRQISAAMDEIIDFSGIGEFIDVPVKVYSSGMYVRLGFSIAANLDPELLIIDEIVAVGDEEFQRRCFDRLYELRRKGTTIVFVSHSLALIQTLCDRVAWIEHGHLRAEGPAFEVVDKYVQEVNAAESDRLAQGGGHEDDRHRGSGELVIKKVEFLDADGVPRPVAVAGRPLTIRMHYEARQPVTEPVFGLAFHHESGVHVSGPNSQAGGTIAGTVDGPGYADYHFEHLPLNAGMFVVTAGIVDASQTHVFDYRDQAFELRVQPGPGPEVPGMVRLDGRWSGTHLQAQ